MHTPRICFCVPGHRSSDQNEIRIHSREREEGGSIQEIVSRTRKALDSVAHFHTPGGVPLKDSGGYPVLPFRPGKTRKDRRGK